MTKRYDVEFNSAETGEETPHLYQTYGQLLVLIRKGKDGDDIVIHVKEVNDAEL